MSSIGESHRRLRAVAAATALAVLAGAAAFSAPPAAASGSPVAASGPPVAASGSLVAAFSPPAVASPAEVAPEACRDDAWECLPAWRWGGIDLWGSDMVSTGADWGVLSLAGRLLNRLINFARALPFMIAKGVWWVTLNIIKLATDPTLIPRIYNKMADEVHGVWDMLLRFLGVPGTQSGSQLWAIAALVAFFGAACIFVKPRTGKDIKENVTQHGVWYNAFRSLLRAVIPLALLTLIAVNLRNPASFFHPMRLMAYPAEKLNSVVMQPLMLAAGELEADSSRSGSVMKNACTRYTDTLEATFEHQIQHQDLAESREAVASAIVTALSRLTVEQSGLPPGSPRHQEIDGSLNALGAQVGPHGTLTLLHDAYEAAPSPDHAGRLREGIADGWRALGEELGGADRAPDASAYSEAADVHVRTALPVMVSDMWQSGYLQLLGMSQFGDPGVSARTSCYLMEWLNWPLPATQRQVMYTALGVGIAGDYDPESGLWHNRADDMFNPASLDGDGQRALLALASACGFSPPDEPAPTPGEDYRTPAQHARYGIQYREIAAASEAKGFVGGRVWLYPEWSGLRNHELVGLDDLLTADACTAWMFPDDSSIAPFHPSGAVGVQSEWLKERSSVDASDAAAWAHQLKRDRRSSSSVPSIRETELVSRVLEAIEGTSPVAGFVYGVWAIVIAVAYLRAFGGLALGFLIAQLVLAAMFFTLPLLLFAVALPIAASDETRKRLIRLYSATVLSYALFYTVLMLIVLLTDVVSSWLTAMTGGDGFVHTILIAASPLIAMWLLGKGLKLLRMDGMLGFQGAVQLSSGLSAAGLELPGMRQLTAKTAASGLRVVSTGLKAGRAVGVTGIAAARAAGSTAARTQTGRARGMRTSTALGRAFAQQARASWSPLRQEIQDFAAWGRSHMPGGGRGRPGGNGPGGNGPGGHGRAQCRQRLRRRWNHSGRNGHRRHGNRPRPVRCRLPTRQPGQRRRL